MKSTLLAGAAAAATLAGTALAQQSYTITFDEPGRNLEHGSVLGAATYADYGVRFSAAVSGNPAARDRAIIFDTNERSTRDPDLEAPFVGGNLAGRDDLGNALIIAENLDWDPHNNVVANPDDNANGGWIWVDFTGRAATELGFSIYDTPERQTEHALEILLTDSLGATALVTAHDLLAWNSGNGIEWGNHHANAYDAITAAQVNLRDIQSAEFRFDGSGALDTFHYTLGPDVIPEPSSILLAGMAGITLLFRRRRAS